MKRFLELLREYDMTAIADVRSSPYSRLHPQFNREDLEESLRRIGVGYVFLGRELGGRSEDPADYEKGRVRYDRLASKPGFASGIERLLRGTREHQIALLCAEKEPLDCHRTLLVAPALSAQGVCVKHICAGGKLTGHGEAMRNLRTMTGIDQLDMFAPTEKDDAKLCARAIALQAAKVGHVWAEPTTDQEPNL